MKMPVDISTYLRCNTYKRNGAREMARRVRQIAAGQLKKENGLV